MALKVFGDPAAGFTLHDEHENQIGWVRDRTIGFRCFPTVEHAAAGARIAYTTLATWSARLGATQAVTELGDGELRIVNDGAYTWFASEQIPVARLMRPRADIARDAGLHGIELVLPRGIGAVTAIGGAQVVYSALVRELRETVTHTDVVPILQEEASATVADAADVA
jgi:hypothetical protein